MFLVHIRIAAEDALVARLLDIFEWLHTRRITFDKYEKEISQTGICLGMYIANEDDAGRLAEKFETRTIEIVLPAAV